MAFCKNCGTQLPDDATFCGNCGTAQNVQNAQQAQQAQPQGQPQQPYGQPYAQPLTPEQQDINANKGYGVLSYIGLLVLIPIFAGKHSKFARFHAGQGATLCALDIAYTICQIIINAIVGAVFPSTWLHYNPIPGIVSTILWLGSVFFVVLMIIGIVNAAKGTYQKLPLIGQLDFISRFIDK